MNTSKLLALVASAVALVFAAGPEAPAQSRDALYDSFVNPPKTARPRVWWHWMNGNITKDGIRKDLEWMDRSGIVGFHNFDAGLESPQVVERRLAYMTAEWCDAFSYAIDVADSLGMEMTIASSPGWSVTGGPWVSYEDAMKKLVWRHLELKGGRSVDVELPQGFANSGILQDYFVRFKSVSAALMETSYYRDIAVLALRLGDGGGDMAGRMLDGVSPVASTSDGAEVPLEQLVNDKVADYVEIACDPLGRAWLQICFDEPVTIRSVQLCAQKEKGDEYALDRELFAGDSEESLKKIKTMPYQSFMLKSYNIAPTTARIWRLALKAKDRIADQRMLVSVFNLSKENCVEDLCDKNGFGLYRYMHSYSTPDDPGVKLEDIIDVTSYVKDGRLVWDAPAGNWRIYRFGYSLIGKVNHPASPEATGLEVDKMDGAAVSRYFNNYLKTYMQASGNRLGEKGISYLLTDSYEAGSATWTTHIEEEFLKRKGYELRKWMPALAGMVVEDGDKTERFLFDWRTTLGSLVSENHYDLQNKILEPYGMKRYTESHENYRALLADGMDCKRLADIPMSAFWMTYKNGGRFTPRFEADIRESASVAHIYGQNIAAAESFTTDGPRDGAWVFSPGVLKPSADAALACGLNRFIIHTSPHQPVDDKVPGLGLGRWGQWFDRHQTWADYASVWTDYLSRSCYMLQQGRFAADVLCYYGEDTNLTAIFLSAYPDIPDGYGFDYASPSVLLDEIRLSDGKMLTDSGMEYRALCLDGSIKSMSLKVLQRIEQIADAGVIIYGQKPQRLADLNADSEQFDALVRSIWDSGRANVSCNIPASKILPAAGLVKDVDWGNEKELSFVHRTMPDADIYWISNKENRQREVNIKFRDAKGRMPELWRADRTAIENASYRICPDGTEVNLGLDPHDAVFVIFRKEAKWKEVRSEAFPSYSEYRPLDGEWQLEFQQGRGAPERAVFAKLESLTQSEDEGIKYFSGAVTYSKTFKLSKKELKALTNKKLALDLGSAYDIAEVKLNGVSLGVLWKAPYIVAIGNQLKKGDNTIEIKIINMWHNRLLAEEKGWTKEKIAYVTQPFFDDKEKLTPSGLIGPVRILVRQ